MSLCDKIISQKIRSGMVKAARLISENQKEYDPESKFLLDKALELSKFVKSNSDEMSQNMLKLCASAFSHVVQTAISKSPKVKESEFAQLCMDTNFRARNKSRILEQSHSVTKTNFMEPKKIMVNYVKENNGLYPPDKTASVIPPAYIAERIIFSTANKEFPSMQDAYDSITDSGVWPYASDYQKSEVVRLLKAMGYVVKGEKVKKWKTEAQSQVNLLDSLDDDFVIIEKQLIEANSGNYKNIEHLDSYIIEIQWKLRRLERDSSIGPAIKEYKREKVKEYISKYEKVKQEYEKDYPLNYYKTRGIPYSKAQVNPSTLNPNTPQSGSDKILNKVVDEKLKQNPEEVNQLSKKVQTTLPSDSLAQQKAKEMKDKASGAAAARGGVISAQKISDKVLELIRYIDINIQKKMLNRETIEKEVQKVMNLMDNDPNIPIEVKNRFRSTMESLIRKELEAIRNNGLYKDERTLEEVVNRMKIDIRDFYNYFKSILFKNAQKTKYRDLLTQPHNVSTELDGNNLPDDLSNSPVEPLETDPALDELEARILHKKDTIPHGEDAGAIGSLDELDTHKHDKSAPLETYEEFEKNRKNELEGTGGLVGDGDLETLDGHVDEDLKHRPQGENPSSSNSPYRASKNVKADYMSLDPSNYNYESTLNHVESILNTQTADKGRILLEAWRILGELYDKGEGLDKTQKYVRPTNQEQQKMFDLVRRIKRESVQLGVGLPHHAGLVWISKTFGASKKTLCDTLIAKGCKLVKAQNAPMADEGEIPYTPSDTDMLARFKSKLDDILNNIGLNGRFLESRYYKNEELTKLYKSIEDYMEQAKVIPQTEIYLNFENFKQKVNSIRLSLSKDNCPNCTIPKVREKNKGKNPGFIPNKEREKSMWMTPNYDKLSSEELVRREMEENMYENERRRTRREED